MNTPNKNILIIPEEGSFNIYHNNIKVGEIINDDGGFLLSVELPEASCAFQIPLVKEMSQAVAQIKSFFTAFD